MGTWSDQSLDNDDASDFAANFNEMKDISMLEEAFDRVCELKSDQYLGAPLAQEAVAAAQILRNLGDSEIDSSNKVRLQEKANSALRRVLEKSELKDLWAESPDNDRWVKSTESLIS